MPPDPLHHSLLSAWFDGEATADEAAEAERLIAESPAARREVLEYAQLSMWLRELPAQPGSNGVAELLRKCEATGTLGASSSRFVVDQEGRAAASGLATVPTNRVPSSKTSKYPATVEQRTGRAGVVVSRGKRSAGLAVAFSAAALLVCVGLFWNADRHEADGLADVGRRRGIGEDIAHHAGERRAMEFESAAAPSPAESVAIAVAEDQEPVARATRRAPADFADEAASFGSSDVLRFREQPPEVGDVLRFVEQSGEEVAVVEVTVLDVQQAAGALEILLERNAIPAADGKRPASLAARPNASTVDDAPLRPGAAAVAEPKLVAVYVETTDRQFADVLEQVAREPLVVAVRTQPGIGKAVAESPRGERRTAVVDSLAERSIADSPLQRAEGATTRTPAEARSLARSTAAGGRAAEAGAGAKARYSVPSIGSPGSEDQALSTAPASPERDGKFAQRNEAAADGKKSWQMRLPLADEAARKLTDKPRGTPVPLAETNRDRDDAPAESTPPPTPNDPPPVRALFLLRPR